MDEVKDVITVQPDEGSAGTTECTLTVAEHTGRVARSWVIEGSQEGSTDTCTVNQSGTHIGRFLQPSGDRSYRIDLAWDEISFGTEFLTNGLAMECDIPEGLVRDEWIRQVLLGNNVLEQDVPFGTPFTGDPGAANAVRCILKNGPSAPNYARGAKTYMMYGRSVFETGVDPVEDVIQVVHGAHPEFAYWTSGNGSVVELSPTAVGFLAEGMSNSPILTFRLTMVDRDVWCTLNNSYIVNGINGYVTNGSPLNPDIGLNKQYVFRSVAVSPIGQPRPGEVREAILTVTGSNSHVYSELLIRQIGESDKFRTV